MSRSDASIQLMIDFILDAFDVKCRFGALESLESILPEEKDLFLPSQFLSIQKLKSLISQLSQGEIAVVTDRLYISWIIVNSDDHIFLAGPILCFPQSTDILLKALANLGLNENSIIAFRQYLKKIPVPSDGFITRFIKIITKGLLLPDSRQIQWVDLFKQFDIHTDKDTNINPYAYNAYKTESEYMESVYAGDIQGASDALIRIQDRFQIAAEINQNIKELDLYGHAVNCTLARIAAYQAGVSPVILDEIFQKYMYLAIQEKTNYNLFRRAFRMTAQVCEQVQYMKTLNYSKKVRNIIGYIMEHYSDHITLTSVADTFGIQKNHLSAIFHKETGTTFTAFVNDTRLSLAAIKLKWNTIPVFEIAQSVGIADYNYFSRLFKNKYHMTPIEFRKQDDKGMTKGL